MRVPVKHLHHNVKSYWGTALRDIMPRDEYDTATRKGFYVYTGISGALEASKSEYERKRDALAKREELNRALAMLDELS